MKTRLTALSVVVATCAVPVLVSSPAFAQEECPPGSWFCEDEGGDVDVDDEVEPADEPPPERVDVPKKRTKQPPPIVVYQPEGEPPPTVVVVKDREPPEPPPKKKRPRWRSSGV